MEINKYPSRRSQSLEQTSAVNPVFLCSLSAVKRSFFWPSESAKVTNYGNDEKLAKKPKVLTKKKIKISICLEATFAGDNLFTQVLTVSMLTFTSNFRSSNFWSISRIRSSLTRFKRLCSSVPIFTYFSLSSSILKRWQQFTNYCRNATPIRIKSTAKFHKKPILHENLSEKNKFSLIKFRSWQENT